MGTPGVTPAGLLQELQAAGASLRVVDGRLEAKHLPPQLAALTKAHAAELRRLLTEPPPLAPPSVDLEEMEHQEETPQGFVHSYRPPPEHRALPPFRWSTPPPTTKRPAPPPTGVTESTEEPAGGVLAPFREPLAGPVHGPQELPEHRAARFGYRIDEFGSWLEAGEASRAPRLARFAVGHEPSAAAEGDRCAQLGAIEADCIARLGPLRGASPLPEPSPDVLPERRRLASGLPAPTGRRTGPGERREAHDHHPRTPPSVTSEPPRVAPPLPEALPPPSSPIREAIETPEAVKNRPSTLEILPLTPCAGAPAQLR